MDVKKLSPIIYLAKAKTCFQEAGDPEVAEKQMKYMRNQFDFYGLKAPVWLPLNKQLFAEYGLFEEEELKTFVRLCYEEDHREIHYLATEMAQRQLRKQAPEFIYFLEEMIGMKSWWDTVDWIAKLVNHHLRKHPEFVRPVTQKWMATGDIWLKRVAITYQRYSKAETDQEMLFDYILQVAHAKEFFLQKGAGWALRDYSKVNPKAVIDFIQTHHLPALTKREGLKWVKKNGLF